MKSFCAADSGRNDVADNPRSADDTREQPSSTPAENHSRNNEQVPEDDEYSVIHPSTSTNPEPFYLDVLDDDALSDTAI